MTYEVGSSVVGKANVTITYYLIIFSMDAFTQSRSENEHFG
jgi:hypothetical protein